MSSPASSPALGWRLLWFVIGAVATYGVLMVLAINKPDGLRGARVGGAYFDAKENDTALDFAIVGGLAVAVGLLMVFRRRIGLAWEFIIGQWAALLAGVIVILVR